MNLITMGLGPDEPFDAPTPNGALSPETILRDPTPPTDGTLEPQSSANQEPAPPVNGQFG